jgi:hypothetical protein
MSVLKTWNNVIDATVIEVTLPTSSRELAELGFPATALPWLNDPVLRASQPGVVEPLDERLLSACKDADVSFVRCEPEDTEFEAPSFYVCFGRTTNQHQRILIRLDLPNPDWGAIEAKVGFPVCPTFKTFAVRYPGLIIGALDYSAYLLSPEYWTDSEILVGRDGQGRFVITKDLLSRLRDFLVFQIDYWAKAKLLDEDQQVWVYDLSAHTLERTGKSFAEWLRDESWGFGTGSVETSS